MVDIVLFDIHWAIVLAAFILDFALGDPLIFPHPIVAMGNAISYFEPKFRKLEKNLVLSGSFFALFLIVTTWLTAFLIIKLSITIHPILGAVVQTILLFYCFSSKTLEIEAMKVFKALDQGGIDAARKQVAMIVGRQTSTLDEKGVTRACVETVAENFVDGFLSPLFFALIGGVPAALAFKMINTLDSMVGYKNDRYLLFGKASARIDDVANFIPSKLSVLIISLAASCYSLKKGMSAFKTGFLQGKLHKSPNAGYPEAAFAGALAMRLGGPSIYHGKRVEKPFIGKAFKDPKKSKIKASCDLMMLSSFVSTLLACLMLFIF